MQPLENLLESKITNFTKEINEHLGGIKEKTVDINNILKEISLNNDNLIKEIELFL